MTESQLTPTGADVSRDPLAAALLDARTQTTHISRTGRPDLDSMRAAQVSAAPGGVPTEPVATGSPFLPVPLKAGVWVADLGSLGTLTLSVA